MNTTSRNLHPLFYHVTRPCFRRNTELDKELERRLLSARAEIRSELQQRLSKVLETLLASSESLAGRRLLLEAAVKELRERTRLTFTPQGSYAFRTINHPAHVPGQQADIDDGVYVSLEFLEDRQRHPRIAGDCFFRAVRVALEDLVRRRGWQIQDKDTCIRVEVCREGHIDLPLYAVRSQEYAVQMEALRKRSAFPSSGDSAHQILEVMEEDWGDLADEAVLLATKNGWEPSDQRKVFLWVQRLVSAHGEQYRQVVRYLKAWRDVIFIKDGPASILIMAMIANAFESHDRETSRDDLALLNVLSKPGNMIDQIVGNIYLPPTGKRLDDVLDVSGLRSRFRNALIGLRSDLETALSPATSNDRAVEILRAQFGSRMPDDASRITAAAGAVLAASPKQTRNPGGLIGRHHSG